MRTTVAVALALLLLVACSGEDAGDTVIEGAGSTASTTSTTSTTEAATATTATTAFEGSTSPTSAPSTAEQVALLTDVRVDGDTVTFAFRADTPGYDVGYVEPPILQDGSGEPIEVAGSAFLQVRMEPASGVDLSGDEFEETYTGPDRVVGSGVIVEVVRTGDFEANLTWVIGLRQARPYRVDVAGSSLTVTFGGR